MPTPRTKVKIIWSNQENIFSFRVLIILITIVIAILSSYKITKFSKKRKYNKQYCNINIYSQKWKKYPTFISTNADNNIYNM